MKKRHIFGLIILLFLIGFQRQNAEGHVKQLEPTKCLYCINIVISTTSTPAILIQSTQTLAAKSEETLTSKTAMPKTIQDYRNACPKGYTVDELDLLAKLIWGEGRVKQMPDCYWTSCSESFQASAQHN